MRVSAFRGAACWLAASSEEPRLRKHHGRMSAAEGGSRSTRVHQGRLRNVGEQGRRKARRVSLRATRLASSSPGRRNARLLFLPFASQTTSPASAATLTHASASKHGSPRSVRHHLPRPRSGVRQNTLVGRRLGLEEQRRGAKDDHHRGRPHRGLSMAQVSTRVKLGGAVRGSLKVRGLYAWQGQNKG